MSLLLRARAVLSPAGWIDGGGLLVRAGRIERLLESASAARRAGARARRTVDLGDRVLTPGLVNAHAHLELSFLRGRLPAGGAFPAWVRGVLAAHGRTDASTYAASFEDGVARALATGTTTLGDIDATGAAAAGAPRCGARLRVYREVLDAWDPGRTAPALRRVRRALPRRRHVTEGLSPHAPLTTSRELLAGAAALAARRRMAVSVHWAETPEERRWLEAGEGPWRELLGAGPRESGLDLLAAAGLLGPRTSLVHGNDPGRGEPERIAASGASLVHCPGTHAFFARPPFPWRRYRRAGVVLALGTDSLASNEDLDLAREMHLARTAGRELSPEDVYAMATTGAARAVGLTGHVGTLAPGAWADIAVWGLDARDRASALELLTSGRARLEETWVGGIRRFHEHSRASERRPSVHWPPRGSAEPRPAATQRPS